MKDNIKSPVRYINHKGVRIPIFGEQKFHKTYVTVNGLIRAALCLLPLAGALFAAWISRG